MKADFSVEGKEELMIYHVKVCKQISRLREAFAERDMEKACESRSKFKNMNCAPRVSAAIDVSKLPPPAGVDKSS